MDILIYIGISIALIIIAFIVGQRTVKHQEQLNNDEVLKTRALIELDLQEKRKNLQCLEQEYEAKKKLIDDAHDAAQQFYDEKVRALDIDYQGQVADYKSMMLQVIDEENEKLAELNAQKEIVQGELQSIKKTRDDAIEAARKEREIQEQPDKYCIPMSDDEIHDIEYLNNVMSRLKFPEVIGKCIWSVFFQKKMKSFLAGILGQEEVCGVYKITDGLTGECYIGQSVKVKARFTEHIKCGIGAIPASNANQLYAAMKRDGIWNFYFELLTECSKEELNAKERQFIDIYSSDVVGLNSKRGNQ